MFRRICLGIIAVNGIVGLSLTAETENSQSQTAKDARSAELDASASSEEAHNSSSSDRPKGTIGVFGGLVFPDDVITNENNGTARKNYETGEAMFARLTLNKLSESKFEIAWEMSKDEGKTWHGVGQMTYTRAA